MGVGENEQPIHVGVGAPVPVVAVQAVPRPQAGNAQIRGTGEDEVVADEADGIDGVVENDAFLEGERLAADGEAEVDWLDAGPIEFGQQAADVAFEKQRLDVQVQLVVEIFVGAVEGIARKPAGQVVVEGPEPEQDFLGAGQLQVGV